MSTSPEAQEPQDELLDSLMSSMNEAKLLAAEKEHEVLQLRSKLAKYEYEYADDEEDDPSAEEEEVTRAWITGNDYVANDQVEQGVERFAFAVSLLMERFKLYRAKSRVDFEEIHAAHVHEMDVLQRKTQDVIDLQMERVQIDFDEKVEALEEEFKSRTQTLEDKFNASTLALEAVQAKTLANTHDSTEWKAKYEEEQRIAQRALTDKIDTEAHMETLKTELATNKGKTLALLKKHQALKADVVAKDAKIAQLEFNHADVATKDARIVQLEYDQADVKAKDAKIAQLEYDQVNVLAPKIAGLLANHARVLELQAQSEQYLSELKATNKLLEDATFEVETLRVDFQNASQREFVATAAIEQIQNQLGALERDGFQARLEELEGVREELASTRGELEIRESELAELTSTRGELESLQLVRASELAELSLTRGEIESLQLMRASEFAELSSTRGELESLQLVRASELTELGSARGELSARALELAEFVSTREQLDSLQSARASESNELASTREQFNSLQSTRNEEWAELASTRGQLASFQSAREEESTKLASTLAEVAFLESELLLAKSQFSLRSEQDEFRIAELTSELEMHQARVETLEHSLSEKNLEISLKNQELNAARVQLNELSIRWATDLEVKTTEVQALQSELSVKATDAQSELFAKTTEAQALHSELLGVQIALSTKTSELAQVSQRVFDLGQQASSGVTVQAAQIVELDETLTAREARIGELINEIESTQGRVFELEEDVQIRMIKIAELEKEFIRNNLEVSELRDEIVTTRETSSGQAQDMKNELTLIQRDFEKLVGESTNSRERAERAESDLGIWRHRSNLAETELARHQNESKTVIARLENDMFECQTKVEDLETAALLTRESEALVSELESWKLKSNDLELKLSQTQTQEVTRALKSLPHLAANEQRLRDVQGELKSAQFKIAELYSQVASSVGNPHSQARILESEAQLMQGTTGAAAELRQEIARLKLLAVESVVVRIPHLEANDFQAQKLGQELAEIRTQLHEARSQAESAANSVFELQGRPSIEETQKLAQEFAEIRSQLHEARLQAELDAKCVFELQGRLSLQDDDCSLALKRALAEKQDLAQRGVQFTGEFNRVRGELEAATVELKQARTDRDALSKREHELAVECDALRRRLEETEAERDAMATHRPTASSSLTDFEGGLMASAPPPPPPLGRGFNELESQRSSTTTAAVNARRRRFRATNSSQEFVPANDDVVNELQSRIKDLIVELNSCQTELGRVRVETNGTVTNLQAECEALRRRVDDLMDQISASVENRNRGGGSSSMDMHSTVFQEDGHLVDRTLEGGGSDGGELYRASRTVSALQQQNVDWETRAKDLESELKRTRAEDASNVRNLQVECEALRRRLEDLDAGRVASETEFLRERSGSVASSVAEHDALKKRIHDLEIAERKAKLETNDLKERLSLPGSPLAANKRLTRDFASSLDIIVTEEGEEEEEKNFDRHVLAKEAPLREALEKLRLGNETLDDLRTALTKAQARYSGLERLGDRAAMLVPAMEGLGKERDALAKERDAMKVQIQAAFGVQDDEDVDVLDSLAQEARFDAIQSARDLARDLAAMGDVRELDRTIEDAMREAESSLAMALNLTNSANDALTHKFLPTLTPPPSTRSKSSQSPRMMIVVEEDVVAGEAAGDVEDVVRVIDFVRSIESYKIESITETGESTTERLYYASELSSRVAALEQERDELKERLGRSEAELEARKAVFGLMKSPGPALNSIVPRGGGDGTPAKQVERSPFLTPAKFSAAKKKGPSLPNSAVKPLTPWGNGIWKSIKPVEGTGWTPAEPKSLRFRREDRRDDRNARFDLGVNDEDDKVARNGDDPFERGDDGGDEPAAAAWNEHLAKQPLVAAVQEGGDRNQEAHRYEHTNDYNRPAEIYQAFDLHAAAQQAPPPTKPIKNSVSLKSSPVRKKGGPTVLARAFGIGSFRPEWKPDPKDLDGENSDFEDELAAAAAAGGGGGDFQNRFGQQGQEQELFNPFAAAQVRRSSLSGANSNASVAAMAESARSASAPVSPRNDHQQWAVPPVQLEQPQSFDQWGQPVANSFMRASQDAGGQWGEPVIEQVASESQQGQWGGGNEWGQPQQHQNEPFAGEAYRSEFGGGEVQFWGGEAARHEQSPPVAVLPNEFQGEYQPWAPAAVVAPSSPTAIIDRPSTPVRGALVVAVSPESSRLRIEINRLKSELEIERQARLYRESQFEYLEEDYAELAKSTEELRVKVSSLESDLERAQQRSDELARMLKVQQQRGVVTSAAAAAATSAYVLRDPIPNSEMVFDNQIPFEDPSAGEPSAVMTGDYVYSSEKPVYTAPAHSEEQQYVYPEEHQPAYAEAQQPASYSDNQQQPQYYQEDDNQRESNEMIVDVMKHREVELIEIQNSLQYQLDEALQTIERLQYQVKHASENARQQQNEAGGEGEMHNGGEQDHHHGQIIEQLEHTLREREKDVERLTKQLGELTYRTAGLSHALKHGGGSSLKGTATMAMCAFVVSSTVNPETVMLKLYDLYSNYLSNLIAAG